MGEEEAESLFEGEGLRDDSPTEEEVAFARTLFVGERFIENSFDKDKGLSMIVADARIGDLIEIIFSDLNGKKFPAVGYVEAIYPKEGTRGYLIALSPAPSLPNIRGLCAIFPDGDINCYRFRHIEVPED